MQYKVLFLEQAELDLNDILDFIAKDAPLRALDYIDILYSEITKLSSFPEIGVLCKRKNVKHDCRILIIDDYLVFYKIDKQAFVITIGRVLHSSVNYKKANIFKILTNSIKILQ